ncbi:MAG TPA: arsenical pump-driving ATPase, partial [Gemmatimonadales bacterium]
LMDDPTRHLFYTGKGGVGKTSNACATAVELADTGRRVLLVSTDPASNLDQVFGVGIGREPTPIPEVPGLSAININPEAAAQAYREQVVGPYRGVLPDDAVAGLEEQLSGACTVEVAAFDEFTELLTADGAAAAFEHVVFDTAPTGHTLRLLQLPAAWTDFLETNERGASCLGPASALKTQQARYAEAVAALADARRTTVILVARPDRVALAEAARTAVELAELGLRNQLLLVNGVFQATDRSDPLAVALERRGQAALAEMPTVLQGLLRIHIPLQPYNIVGVPALRRLADHEASAPQLPASPANRAGVDLPSLAALVDEVATAGHGLVMVMGKGGVGKTTIAAAVAVELAGRGLPVHLTTTDPAAHLNEALGREVPGLRVSRIDPAAETRAYREKILERSGRKLDAAGLALLDEDLRSPCTEEVAVFHAFSRLVFGARNEIVVMDTAPTGHTLLLLDATGAYHREMLRNAADAGVKLQTPLMRLRDPDYTRVLLVTLAETTPVLEAAELQADLRRAGIEPFAWVVNASLAAAGPRDPVLAARAAAELEQIACVETTLAARVAVVPWLPEEPRGVDRLRQILAPGRWSASLTPQADRPMLEPAGRR